MSAERICSCGVHSIGTNVLRERSNLKCICYGTHTPRIVKTIRKEKSDTDEDVLQMCRHEVFMTNVASRYGFALKVVDIDSNGRWLTTHHAGRSLDYTLRHVPPKDVQAVIFL